MDLLLNQMFHYSCREESLLRSSVRYLEVENTPSSNDDSSIAGEDGEDNHDQCDGNDQDNELTSTLNPI